MTDGVPKATGNAYLAKASLPATYADFKAAIEAGTQGLDLSFNSAGWAVIGTLLSKAKLLPDTVRDALGLTGDASVADALGALNAAVGDRPIVFLKRGTFTENSTTLNISLADLDLSKYIALRVVVSPIKTVSGSFSIYFTMNQITDAQSYGTAQLGGNESWSSLVSAGYLNDGYSYAFSTEFHLIENLPGRISLRGASADVAFRVSKSKVTKDNLVSLQLKSNDSNYLLASGAQYAVYGLKG